MEFDLGNIITMGICILVILIFRQLDKNNRSLEKIKRFSDKVRQELDAFIDQKGDQLKSYTIELDVHQKAGKQILNRITEIEEGLAGRMDKLDLLQQRIDGYDGALKDLDQMAERAEANLSRLQTESEYIDKVGRRLKILKEKTVEMEKEMGKLPTMFAQENQSQLNAVKDSLLQETNQHIQQISDEIIHSKDMIRDFAGQVQDLEDQRQSLEERSFANIKNELDRAVDEASQRAQTIRQASDTNYEEFAQKLTHKGSLVEQSTANHIREMEAELGRTKFSLFNDLKAVKTDHQNLLEEITSKADQASALYQKAAKEAVAQSRELKGEIFENLRKEIDASAENNNAELKAKLAAFGESLTSEAGVLHKKLEQVTHQFGQDQERITSDARAKQDEMISGLNTLQGKVNSSLEEMDNRMADYEKGINYRFIRLEDVRKDLDGLEGHLKDAMEAETEKLIAEFKTFEEEMALQRNQEVQKNSGHREQLDLEMARLEKDLSDLKSRAYDNVSEKLKIFEDEFFTGLRDRDQAMDKKLNDWQDGINLRVNDMEREGIAAREEQEKLFHQDLSTKLEEMRARIFQQYEKFDLQIGDFENRIGTRITATDGRIDGVVEDIAGQIDGVKEESRLNLEKVFGEYQTNISEQLTRSERDLSTNLTSLRLKVEEERKDLLGMIESSRSDVTVWQTKTLQHMKASQNEVGEQVSQFEDSIKHSLQTIQGEFSEQRDDLIAETRDERSRLKMELKDVSEGVDNLSAELKKRSESALEEFGREYETFSLDFQKMVREMHNEADHKIKEFRVVSAETKDKIEGIQKKLSSRMEDNYKTLTVTLNEIDKRVKGFMGQTKLFDRADSLKVALQENIEDLKSEVSRVEIQTKEIREAEKKFETVRKLGEDVADRLNRFMNEKRRVDEMEGDFKQLLNISQAVDQKLQQVTSSHDQLQSIQVRIRSLEELQKEVGQRYERLIKKREVLDATTTGVDQNFQRLEDLEGKLRTFESDIARVPRELERISGTIDLLSRNKDKADEAAGRIQEINQILVDLEDRIESMQKAREWLAKTETRLEEINKQAQEQVKLLGSIMRDGGNGKDKGNDSAPPMAARDMVTRLAHQGWSVQEIARATKLSRGEVELILELLPKA